MNQETLDDHSSPADIPEKGRFFGKDIGPFTGSKPQKETVMSSNDTNNQPPPTENQCVLMDLVHQIELVAVKQLVPYRGNARTHSRKQVRQIGESIKQFGFTNPVLIDDRNGI